MDVIDALWYGELAPFELGGRLDEKQRALNRLIIQNEAELAPLLSEQAAPVLEKLSENRSELNRYENRLAFREGFASAHSSYTRRWQARRICTKTDRS